MIKNSKKNKKKIIIIILTIRMNYYTFLNYLFLAPKPRNISSSLLRNILVNYPLIFASSFFLFFFFIFFLEVTPLSGLMVFSQTKIIFFFFLPFSLFFFSTYFLLSLIRSFLSSSLSFLFIFLSGFFPFRFPSSSSFFSFYFSLLSGSFSPPSLCIFFLSSSLTFLSFFSIFDFQHVMVKIFVLEKKKIMGRERAFKKMISFKMVSYKMVSFK